MPRPEVIGFEMLKEKTAMVTGGSRGIGRAAAIALAEAGADVAVSFQHSADAANAVCREVRHLGVRARAYRSDVGQMNDMQLMVERVLEDFGHVDILVNNAGITRDKSFLKMTDEMWDEVLRTNLNGPANAMRAVLPGMIAAGWGRIINVSSIVGLAGNFGQANYSAAKGGLIALTKTLARETARKGVTVNAVAPGFIETDMTKDLSGEAIKSVESATPVGRLGLPHEVAAAIVFLATPAASYVTGQVISVNGGMYM
jgi:3-oxoacyl-(acyl-carrier-protein) reductase